MIRLVFLTALIAGAIGGSFVSIIQLVRVVPVIYEAESYEHEDADGAPDQGSVDASDSGADSGSGHQHGEGWAPDEGLERVAFTFAANILASTAFALLLTAAFALVGAADGHRGLLWGLAGFATFSLAPALGLPPELPGAAAAELGARQGWWLLTVITTGAGLYLIFGRRVLWRAGIGVVLLALPHMIGAPQPADHGGLAPARLQADFIAAVLVTNLFFWALLGTIAGHLFDRLDRTAAARA